MVRLILRRGIVLSMAVALAAGSASLVLAESPPPSGGPTVAGDDLFDATEDEVLEVLAPGLLANDNYGPDTCVVVTTDFRVLRASSCSTRTARSNTRHRRFSAGSRPSNMAFTPSATTCVAGNRRACNVTITVASVNDAPTATADSFIVLKDRTLNVGVPGVLINDHDVDGDTLGEPGHRCEPRTLLLAPSGAFSYTPASGYVGTDGFSYHASDGSPDHSPTCASCR